jgi:hypothetical protein
MRTELRWIGAAVAALIIGSTCAKGYARLASPYFVAVGRVIALGHPWTIVSVDVRPAQSGPGSVLLLVGDVRRRPDDAMPAARVLARVQVGEVVETPMVFWTLLLLWPAASRRERVQRCVVAVPVFLGLEAITTAVQLMHNFPEVSALLAGERDPITLWERWSRFLEAGGRFVIEVCAVLLAVTIAAPRQAGSDRAPSS